VPWARYSEINEGLVGGRDVIGGALVDMNDIKVDPMSALIVEFKR
jgi:hypothetical protein